MARVNVYSSTTLISTAPEGFKCDFWSNVNVGLSTADKCLPSSLYKGQEFYNNDRALYARMQAEYTNQNGVVMEWYVTSYDGEADAVWGEDDDRKFLRKFDVMAYFDELPQDQFTWGEYGVYSMDVWKCQVSEYHFSCASKLAAEATPNPDRQGVEEGFTRQEDKLYESHLPKTNDYVRLKIGNEPYYYEVLYADKIKSFLQGDFMWEITIRRYKDEQIEVSDAYGQAETMNDMDRISDNRGEDKLDVTEANAEQLETKKYIATDDLAQPSEKDAWINSGGDKESYDATGGWWDEH